MKEEYGSGNLIRKRRYAEFVLTCSIILPSIVKIFLTVAELCSGNELLTPARIHHFNNQSFPSENLVKIFFPHSDL